MEHRFKILYGFLGGAVAWTLHLLGSYAISEGLCRSDPINFSFLGLNLMHVLLLLLTFIAIALTVGAILVARRQQFANIDRLNRGQSDVYLFMSRSSLMTNFVFLLIIIPQALPIIVLARNC